MATKTTAGTIPATKTPRKKKRRVLGARVVSDTPIEERFDLTKIRSRIKELRHVKASELKANPKNWRKHPKQQVDALKAVLGQVGFVQAAIGRELPDGSIELLDGHARTGVAEQENDSLVPVLVLDLTDAEADFVLATFDPIGTLAQGDGEILSNLVKNIQMPEGLDLKIMFSGREDVPTLDEVLRSPQHQFSGIDLSAYDRKDFFLRPQFVPTTTKYGIPELRSDMLAELPEKIIVYSGNAGYSKPDDGTSFIWAEFDTSGLWALPPNRTIVSFYTEDEPLENLWDGLGAFASKMLYRKFPIAVVPNYSCYPLAPEATRIWSHFRQRYVGRLFQEVGIKVIPNIEFGLGSRSDFEFYLEGIPKNPPAIAFQAQNVGYGSEYEKDEAAFGLNLAVKTLKPEKILVQGVANAERVIDKSWKNRAMIIPTRMDVRRDNYSIPEAKRRKEINKSINMPASSNKGVK